MSYDVIASQPIVIDNGSGVIKAGFAGEDYPKVHFNSYIGRPKHARVMTGGLEGDMFMGPKAEEHRGLLNIKYPVEHGIVTDWNDMEQIWTYIYSKEMLAAAAEDHPVLLTEAPLNPRSNRVKAAEVFFETFNVPALYISMQAVLSLSVAKILAILCNRSHNWSGAGLWGRSDACSANLPGVCPPPLHNEVGHCGPRRHPLPEAPPEKRRPSLKTTSEFEIVRTMKEKVCRVTLNPQKDEQIDQDPIPYQLPDGSVVQIGRASFRAPELLFYPYLIGEESEGIHEVLAYSIRRSDLDLRKTFYSNIVLSGGSTLFKGFGDRLLSEIKKLTPKDVKIRISAPQDRLYSTWMGGSILAALDTFKKMWVSKKEYR
ncbi:Alpha-centractin [Geodia barretti]|uniref:Alpha-centractin n=1 Tax=Geodia barretti TaxID=519541 RepID=A0AA35SN49_GEOBA|nr:Alpha-centractin [Geodia barretti]